MYIPTFESTACENTGEGLGVVVSTHILIDQRSAPKFGRQDNHGIFQFTHPF